MIQKRTNESDEDYQKRKRRVKLSMMGGLANGGGSLILAAIIYNMDTFNLDVDVRTIDNAGAESSSADAPMYASNHIFLDGSTQSVDYPIPHTLGSESSSGVAIGQTDIVVTDEGLGVYDVVLTDNSNAALRIDSSLSNTIISLLTFTITEVGTLPIYDTYYDGTEHTFINYQCVAGYNEIEVKSRGDSNIWLYGNSAQTGVHYKISDISVKEITNPNSFLTYFDTATKSHVTIDNSISPSTTYTQEDSHSNTFTTTVALTDLDRSLLNLTPESIARLVDGETVSELSFDLTDIEAFYPGNEGEASSAFVQDVTQPFGSEGYSGVFPVNGDVMTDLGGGDWNLVGTSQNRLYFGQTGNISTTSLCRLEFTATINSGGATILRVFNDSVWITLDTPHVIVDGLNEVNVQIASLQVHCDISTSTYDIDFRDVSIKEIISYSEIINYASTCRTNLDLTNYGASNFLYTQDATGRFTGMADEGTIVGASDGRNIDIQMTTPYNHLVTKDIDKIEGTLDSCTITYVDTTTEIVP